MTALSKNEWILLNDYRASLHFAILAFNFQDLGYSLISKKGSFEVKKIR
jgi:hypothetical protein